jgi:hypothetical protein
VVVVAVVAVVVVVAAVVLVVLVVFVALVLVLVMRCWWWRCGGGDACAVRACVCVLATWRSRVAAACAGVWAAWATETDGRIPPSAAGGTLEAAHGKVGRGGRRRAGRLSTGRYTAKAHMYHAKCTMQSAACKICMHAP